MRGRAFGQGKFARLGQKLEAPAALLADGLGQAGDQAAYPDVAPRQRRGLKALIGVSASSAESMGRIGPCADRL